MSGFKQIWVHQSLNSGEQALRRVASLCNGELDNGFHYQGGKQAELWLEVHKRHAPLFADPEFAEIFHAVSVDAADSLAGQAVHVIGLGPGGGEKESWLLEALSGRGCRLRYSPVDASLQLALLSAEVAKPYVGDEIFPVVGDLSLLAELPAWLERYPREESRVFTAFGLAPNFFPSQLFPRLAAVLRPQDMLLLSANLASSEDVGEDAYRDACEAVLLRYDNPEMRIWLRQTLVDWGIANYLSELVFEIRSIENILGLVVSSAWQANVSFDWQGMVFEALKGQSLQLFFSLRYTPKLLREKLELYGLELGRGHCCRQDGVWRVASKSFAA